MLLMIEHRLTAWQLLTNYKVQLKYEELKTQGLGPSKPNSVEIGKTKIR